MKPDKNNFKRGFTALAVVIAVVVVAIQGHIRSIGEVFMATVLFLVALFLAEIT